MVDLVDVYRRLHRRFGPQHWWPARTKFEILVGAVLTQRTAWANVERALANLRQAGLLRPEALAAADRPRLERLIWPAGFYTQKAPRLQRLARFVVAAGGLTKTLQKEPSVLRRELLDLDGIGPETADSILLYAAGHPRFVVDAYTIRILHRLELSRSGAYASVQERFERELPSDASLYQEYHALLVALGKTYCRTTPVCEPCPLLAVCRHGARVVGRAKP